MNKESKAIRLIVDEYTRYNHQPVDHVICGHCEAEYKAMMSFGKHTCPNCHQYPQVTWDRPLGWNDIRE